MNPLINLSVFYQRVLHSKVSGVLELIPAMLERKQSSGNLKWFVEQNANVCLCMRLARFPGGSSFSGVQKDTKKNASQER